MGLINYKDIDFNKSINKENKIINFNGSEIQIINYLPINDKYDLVMTTLKKAFENEIYNSIKIEMYFDLHLIYMYTNIIFDVEDKVDQEEIYDILFNSGLISLVKENINQNELGLLNCMLQNTLQVLDEYNLSIKGFLSDIFDEVLEKVSEIIKVFKNIDPELVKKTLANNLEFAKLIPNKED